ncbi:MAG: FGGY-family carbohydrate kinase [Caldilineaceae bacterium]
MVGHITPAAAAAAGLAAGTPVVIGGGDGSCAGIGAGVVEPGALLRHRHVGVDQCEHPGTGARSPAAHHDVPSRASGTLRAHGGHATGGGARMGLAGAGRRRAGPGSGRAAAPVGADGLIFLPYLMGERSPWWNPERAHAFVGLGVQHDKATMARAVLEGVGFGLGQILDSLREQVDGIDAIRLIGGGGAARSGRRSWPTSFELPVHPLELTGEATSWGAAVAAGVAVVVYDWSIAAHGASSAVYAPDAGNVARYRDLKELFRDSYLALTPIYARLAHIAGR